MITIGRPDLIETGVKLANDMMVCIEQLHMMTGILLRLVRNPAIAKYEKIPSKIAIYEEAHERSKQLIKDLHNASNSLKWNGSLDPLAKCAKDFIEVYERSPVNMGWQHPLSTRIAENIAGFLSAVNRLDQMLQIRRYLLM